MLTMTPASWLFVKGNDSIRIVRPEGFGLIVLGPGPLRHVHDFKDEAEMQAYQMSVAEELSEQGWMLLGMDVERRSGRDRRGVARGTPNRRRT